MKIKEHLQLAFTNPIGNVLGIANLIMLSLGHNLSILSAGSESWRTT